MKLPLFPLNAVLFPGCRLDLQIFEARYLDMISRCMKQGTGFGVVTIGEGRRSAKRRAAWRWSAARPRSATGSSARTACWASAWRAVGVSRCCRWRSRPTSSAVGEIEWFEDLPEQPLTYEHNDLAALLSVLAEHPMVAALEMGGEPGGQQDLANQLAYLLPFDTERKLELLALPDAQMQLARIQVLLEHLQGELGID